MKQVTQVVGQDQRQGEIVVPEEVKQQLVEFVLAVAEALRRLDEKRAASESTS